MTTPRGCGANRAATLAAGLTAGGRWKKCVGGLVVGRIRVSGRHSQAMGEPIRRSTLGADGCEKGLRRREKAVYTSYKLSSGVHF